MTAVLTSHIVLDDQGRPWIEGTATKVIEVVLDWLAYGWSPDEIHRQHPHLPLAKIHGAFAYYYDHQAEIDAEIERQEREFDQIKGSAADSPLHKRLKAMGEASVSVRLYIDEHVPMPVTIGLRAREVDVLTAQEDDYAGEDDAIILQRPSSLGRVVFTMDEDFFRETSTLQRAGTHFAGVVYARQLSITIGQCVRDLELICKAGEPEDLADRIDVLPL